VPPIDLPPNTIIQALLDDFARPGETREIELSKPAHERPHAHYDPPERYDLPVEITPNTGALKIDVRDAVQVIDSGAARPA
jgi:hypothetical protein